MSEQNKSMAVSHDETKLKLRSYVIGFSLSIFLTLTAYLLVTHQAANRDVLIGIVIVLAMIQFLVQIFYFLHLGQETKPRWKLGVFFFMIGVVLIIVFGSLWIMANLNYRETIPQEENYVNSQDDL
jgi:cytochrome o ubiquinol oxidase operon protein cyoD